MTTSVRDIPETIKQTMIASKVWKPECPVTLDRLKLLEIQHYTFEGDIRQGQMVVLDGIAGRVAEIFKSLFKLRFPINKIQLMDTYAGSDDASMEDNNSSCLNVRNVAGTDKLSVHSYGLAIDINPLQNPYVNGSKVYPSGGNKFLDRSNIRPGMVEKIVYLFKEHGFEWGGDWTSPIDYHHFQMSIKNFGFK